MRTTDDRFARWDRGLAALLLGAPAMVLLAAAVVPNGATRIYTWPWAFYVQVSLIAPLFWCGWAWARGRTGSAIAWRLVLPLLAALTLSVVASAHRHDAIEAALTLVSPLMLLPFAADAWRRANAAHRLIAVRIAGAALAAPAVASLAYWLADTPPELGLRWLMVSRNPHPLGHWNYTGGLGLVTLPLAIFLAWREARPWRIVWIAAIGLGLVEIASSGSRGAALGLLASTGTAAVLIVLRRGVSFTRVALVVAALGLALLLAVAVNPRLRQVARDPASIVKVGESEQQRIGFIMTGYRIARAHPWLGIGPGTTPYHYPLHRADLPGSLENSFQLHCGPLQWCVDTGVIGLAALLFAAGVMKVRVWRSRRRLGAEATTTTVMLAGYGVLWLTDYQLDVPLFPVVLALAASVLLAQTESEETQQASGSISRRDHVCAIATCLLALALAAALTPAWRARAAFSAAWQAKDDQDAAGFVLHLRQAAELAPWQPYYHNHLAAALAGIAKHMPSESAAAFREEAAAAWRESLQVSPGQDHPWLNLGWLALARGDTHEAIRCLESAAGIYPRRIGLWLAVALARMGTSDNTGAALSLAREIRVNPAFIFSPLWNDATFSSFRPEVLHMLAGGWAAAGTERGARPAPRLATVARWWWTGASEAEAASLESSQSAEFLKLLGSIDDATSEQADSKLGVALGELRRSWRLRQTALDDTTLTPEIATAWIAHLQAHPGADFSMLLRSFPGAVTRTVQRGADGILFRQTDGDVLTDLTAIPAPPLAEALAFLLPKPEVGEFMEGQDPASARIP